MNNITRPTHKKSLLSNLNFFKFKNKRIKNKKIVVISEYSSIYNFPILGGIISERAKSAPENSNIIFFTKWDWQDSNLRPTDYESVALTN